jgi:hypothetical protein
MTFRITDQVAGSQKIAENSATLKHPLGTIVRAVDEVFGEGEFIYLLGVGSTTVGAIVNYDVATTSKWQTALSTTAVAKSNPLAIAMSANVASQYGWYQISGLAVASKLLATSLVVGSTIMAIGGEAEVSATSNIIQGAMTALVTSANTSDAVLTVQLMINRPANAAIA